MKVGLKDINGVELKHGQSIRIFDKEDGYRMVVDGIINYVPAAFIIHPKDGSHDLLLYWYLRNDEIIDVTERYDIEIYQ
ncbi:MAG: hypothetical protein PHT02_00990 [Tissierellia bacterium]|nr:hypothetical protein [Tissierellia bacterium]